MTTWGRRAGWLSALGLLAVLLQSFFQQPVAVPLAAAVLCYVGLSAWRPFDGLLLLAGIGPLASMLMVLGRGDAGLIVLAEVLLLAYLTGFSIRQAIEPRALHATAAVRYPALLIALAAVASAVVQSARTVVEMQGEPVSVLVRDYIRDYALHAPGGEVISAAALMACGMLLLLAAAHLTAGSRERRTAVLRMVVCGAAGAAAVNLLRVVTVSLRHEDSIGAFFELLATIRVNEHYADLNAAGSYFAMALLLTLAIASRARGLFAVAAPLIGAALWLTGSRFALASAGVATVGACLVYSQRAQRRIVRVGALVVVAALVVGAAAAWWWYPEGRNVGVEKALGIRLELARAGFEMAEAEPVFGVGLGRYYRLSNEHAGEALTALGFVRENAHNNFIQILAELGVPGVVAFILLLLASSRELERSPATSESRWLSAALAAFLLTCLGGHPLLVPDTAVAFWLTLGLAAAPPAAPPEVRSRWRYVPVVLPVLLLASLWPRTTAAMRTADLASVSFGLSKWQRDQDGQRFRWAGGRSAFYVTSSAQAVRIPLWNGATDRLTIEVVVLMEGREVTRVMLPADDRWRVARVLLRPKGETAFTRFDLLAVRAGETAPLLVIASDTAGAIRVGRPQIEP